MILLKSLICPNFAADELSGWFASECGGSLISDHFRVTEMQTHDKDGNPSINTSLIQVLSYELKDGSRVRCERRSHLYSLQSIDNDRIDLVCSLDLFGDISLQNSLVARFVNRFTYLEYSVQNATAPEFDIGSYSAEELQSKLSLNLFRSWKIVSRGIFSIPSALTIYADADLGARATIDFSRDRYASVRIFVSASSIGASLVKREFSRIEKKEVERIPPLGEFLRSLESFISLDRKKTKSLN